MKALFLAAAMGLPAAGLCAAEPLPGPPKPEPLLDSRGFAPDVSRRNQGIARENIAAAEKHLSAIVELFPSTAAVAAADAYGEELRKLYRVENALWEEYAEYMRMEGMRIGERTHAEPGLQPRQGEKEADIGRTKLNIAAMRRELARALALDRKSETLEELAAKLAAEEEALRVLTAPPPPKEDGTGEVPPEQAGEIEKEPRSGAGDD